VRTRGQLRLAVSLLLVGVAWGVMYALYPIGLDASGPVALAAWRFVAFFVGAVLASFLLRAPLRRPRSGRDWAGIASYAGFNVVLHNLGMMAGAGHVPVALVGLATGLNPLLTLALARVALPGTRVTRIAIVGLLVSLAGVGLLALRGGVEGGALPWFWILVVLGGVAAWAAGSVALKVARPGLPALSLAAWSSLAGAAVLLPVSLALEPSPRIDASYVLVVAFSGLVGGLGAFLIWNQVVHRFGPHRANLSSYVSPVAASFAAWVLLDQAVGWVHLASYGLVALGLTLALAGPRAPSAPAASPE
jgi:drug/metabolite transporter (DMT)-like permease